MPDKKSELIDESMQRILAKIQSEMPDVRKTSMSPFGIIDRLTTPDNAVATTSPITGNINYNPHMLQVMSPDERENTVAHEMTHVRQQQNTPFLRNLLNTITPQLPYNQRGDEMEAYQTERDRSLRNHLSMPDPQSGATDINLPRDSSSNSEFLRRMQNRGVR